MRYTVFTSTGETRAILHKFDRSGVFMNERSITTDYEAHEPIGFQPGDWIEYKGQRYTIEHSPTIKKTSTDSITYSLQFVSRKYELERCQMRNLVPNDNGIVYASPLLIEFTGKVNYLTERIQACLDDMYGAGVWTITIEDRGKDEEKNISLQNTNCWSALSLVYSEYGLYFYVNERDITITSQRKGVIPIHLRYGYQGGLYTIERNADSATGIVTKLRAYGGERNLDYSYPKQPEYADSVLEPTYNLYPLRVMLPSFKLDGKTDYIMASAESVNLYGVREASITYDDIYPSITGATNSKGQRIDRLASVTPVTDENSATFKVTTYPMDFKNSEGGVADFKEDLLTTTPAQLNIKTGTLQGYTFNITDAVTNEDGSYVLTLERGTLSDYGEEYYVPNKDWNASAGDEFVLLHIVMPQSYVLDAEQRLLARAQEYLEQYSKTNFSYSVTVSEKFLVDNNLTNIQEGMVMIVDDPQLGWEGVEVLIQSITVREGEDSYLPKYELTLNNEPTADVFERIQGQISNLESTTAAGFTAQQGIYAQYHKKLDKSVWDSVFIRHYDNKENPAELTSLESKVGLWTNSFISSKGKNPNAGGGGEGGATALYQLNDVKSNTAGTGVEGAATGKVLTYGSDGFWYAGDAVGLDEAALETYLTTNSYAKKSDIPSLSGYATQSWVNTRLGGYTTTTDLTTLLGNKVDKVEGKGLSSNDFTDALLTKLNSLENYTLPTASATVLGGVKVGTTLGISNGVLNLKSGIITPGSYVKVTVDTYGRAVGAGTLASDDIPTLAISKISGLQTALDGKANTDGSNATGIWGISITGSAGRLSTANLTNEDLNDFTYVDYSGKLYYATGNNTTANKPFASGAYGLTVWRIAAGYTGQLMFATNGNIYQRYGDGNKWNSWNKILNDSNYATTLDGRYVTKSFLARLFGAMDASGNEIAINDISTVIDNIKAKVGLWTEEYISSKGLNPNAGGGGGSDYDRLDSWSDYTADKAGYVLSAGLGWDLNTRVQSLESSSVTLTTTGTGNGLAGFTQTGNNVVFTKANFLTSHQTIYGLTIQKNGTSLGTYTPNSAAKTINITVPTKVSELSNDSGFALKSYVDGNFPKLDSGLIPASYLPSYVDDVIEAANLAAFPKTGESGKIYVALDTNLTYRWSGTTYVEISPSLALGETATTAYPGDKGKTNATAIAALKAITISAGTGLSGGGNLTANRTISLNVATTSTLGGIKVGDRLSIDTNGVLSATYTYTLPTASATVLGGVKVGTTLAISSGVLNLKATGTAGTYFKVTTDAYGRVTAGSNPTTLSGFGITDGVNTVSVTGSGNAITSASISGHTLTLTKGTTFLTKAAFDDLFEKVNIGTSAAPVYAIKAKYGLYTEQFLSCMGLAQGSGGGSGSDLDVYGSSDLGGTFDDKNLGNTFNAYTINDINSRVVSLEGGAAVTVTPSGTGSVVTGVTKSGTVITVTKGNLAFGSLTGKPTTLSGYGITDAVTLTTPQEISGQKTFSNSIRLSNKDIQRVNAATGTNATGSWWRTANYATTIAGVGCLTIDNANPRLFMGWSEAPWELANSLTVSSTSLTYKNNAILHAGNYNTYAPTKTGAGASGTWGISITGNAATATKLGTATVGSTSKGIYLNAGVPTAMSATVGDSNVPVYMNAGTITASTWGFTGTTGNRVRKSGYVYSATASLSSYWGKLASITFNDVTERDITLYVHSGAYGYYGIVAIRTRWESATAFIVSLKIISGNLLADRLRLYYDASKSTGNVELWANVAAQWGTLNAYVLSSTNRTGAENGDITMFTNVFTTAQTLPTTPYVSPTYITLYNNANTATQLQTARTINGTNFNGTNNITTSYWGTARSIGIVNSDGTGTAVVTSVNGSANVNLKLPATIKATLTGNASSATKLATARNITVGAQSRAFDGTSDITFTRSGMKTAYGDEVAYSTTSTAEGWLRIAYSASGISNCNGIFTLVASASGYHTVATIDASVSYGRTAGANITQLGCSQYNSAQINAVRLVYHATYTNNYAYLEIQMNAAVSTSIGVKLIGGTGWNLYTAATAGSIPSGYTSKSLTLADNSLKAYTFIGALTGNASTATKLATARTLWGKSFDGTGNVSGAIKIWATCSATPAITDEPRLEFASSDGTQKVALVYSNYDSYRAAAGIKVIGDQTPIWLECPYIYAPTHITAGGYNNESYSLSTSSFICNSWIRTVGAAGWYSESYGGGIYMTDSTWVRTYNNKKFHVANSEKDAIFVTKGIRIGNYYITSTDDGLYVTSAVAGKTGGLYTDGFISSLGFATGTGGGGGSDLDVYGSADLGKTFDDKDLTNTFNAFTTASIAKRVTALEGGSALTVTTTGSGNAVTSVTKSGTAITVTKGATFLTSHQSLANYVTLNSAQTITAQKTWTTSQRMSNTSIWRVNSATGGNATGSHWFTATDYATIQFGIGVYTDANASPRAYIGWGVNPWVTTTNLTVSSTQFTYKNNVILHAANYNDYAPTKTGTGASGTWGISISGGAAKLTTARTIWGQSFNGTANVSGALSGATTISASGLISTTAENPGFLVKSGSTNKSCVGWLSNIGAYLYSYECASYLGINPSGYPTFGGGGIDNMIPHTRKLFSKADYEYYVVLLWKTSEQTYHRLTGKVFTVISSGTTRYQAADVNLYHARWSATGQDYSYVLNTYGQGEAWKLVTCTYGGEQYLALRHTNIQATNAFFVGTFKGASFTAVKYYTIAHGSTAAVINNSEINGSIADVTTSVMSANGTPYALTSSNVASATKLQTARTLWGQSFNGTANVSGSLSNVGSISFTGATATYSIGTASVVANTVFSRNIQSDSTLYLKSASSTSIILHVGTTEVARFLQPNGYLGLGTTAPTQRLHVSGNIRATGYFYSDAWFENTVVNKGLYNSAGDARWYWNGSGWYADKAIASASTIQGTQLKSTIATGTAPLTVSSTTMVSNLNAQMVGGIGASNLPLEYDAAYIPSGTAARWLRIAYFDYSAATGSYSGTFAISNGYTNDTNRGFIFNVTTSHGTTAPVITQIGGDNGVFTSVRIVKDTTTTYPTAAKVYLEVYYNSTSAGNAVYVSYRPENRSRNKWTLYTTYTAGSIPTGYTAIATLTTTIGMATTGGLRVQQSVSILGNTNHNSRLSINNLGYIYPYSTSTRSAGMYGVYDSAKIGHIWSMGTTYKISDDGANFGNLYGFAYKHTNNATGGNMATGHQAVWCENGTPRVAIGTNFWVANSATVGGSLSVTGAATLSSTLTVSGVLTASSTLNVTGILNANNTTDATSTTSAGAVFDGGVGIAKQLRVGSTITGSGAINGLHLGISNMSATTGYGLSLYAGAVTGMPTYGIAFAGTGTFGTHGGVTSDWATYLTMSDTTTRGWIFRRGTTNVASISGTGTATLSGGLSVASTSTFTGKTTHNGGLGATTGTFSSTLSVTGVATFSNATDATSTTAAGVKVTGGLGVAKQLRVGSTSTFTGKTTHNGGIAGTTMTLSGTGYSILFTGTTSRMIHFNGSNGDYWSHIEGLYSPVPNGTQTVLMNIQAGIGGVQISSTNGTLLIVGQTEIYAQGVLHNTTGMYSDGYMSSKGQNTSSDMRLKNRGRDVLFSVKEIAEAPAFEYTWKDGTSGTMVGSSAQYWAGVNPNLAPTGPDGKYLVMQYGNVALTAAISLARHYETLEQKVVRLEKEVKELKIVIENINYK